MKGVIRTEELNINTLGADVVAVLEDKDTLQIVTIKHISFTGDWIVMGEKLDNYAVPTSAKLSKLVIVSNTGTYPLKFNQWAKAIQAKEVNSDKEIEFESISAKFKEGKYINTCSECSAQFLGAKKQPTCEICCKKIVTAKVINVKPKRPRLISLKIAKEIAINAYLKGKNLLSRTDFEKWLKNQFEDANNVIDNQR